MMVFSQYQMASQKMKRFLTSVRRTMCRSSRRNCASIVVLPNAPRPPARHAPLCLNFSLCLSRAYLGKCSISIQYKLNGTRKRAVFRTREVLDDRDPQAVAVVVETPMQKKERNGAPVEFPHMKKRSVCRDRLVTQTEENNAHPQKPCAFWDVSVAPGLDLLVLAQRVKPELFQCHEV